MKNKVIATFLVGVCLTSTIFAGCGNTTQTKNPDSYEVSDTEADTEDVILETEAIDEDTEAVKETESIDVIDTEAVDLESTETPTETEMTFSIKGKIYTIGKTTLQELILQIIQNLWQGILQSP